MGLPLHTKYRPKNFDEFKGNETTVRGLKTLLKKQEDMPHVFLFTGPSGSGKTTLARILANELGCNFESDFYELNTANTRGIDTIREMISVANYEPLLGKVKVFLLDECHMITGQAQEALLKFLEDTPKHVYVILCTTEPEKLNITTKNRCSQWSVSLLNEELIIKLLDWVLTEEKKTIDSAVKSSIAIVAEGCPRTALVLLEKIIDLSNIIFQLQIIEAHDSEAEIAKSLSQLIWKREPWEKLANILENLEKFKDEPESLRYAMLGYFSKIMLNSEKDSERDRASKIVEIFSNNFFYTKKAGLILACYKARMI